MRAATHAAGLRDRQQGVTYRGKRRMERAWEKDSRP